MKVKYFAWVRERIGKSEETIEPQANVRTVDDLIAWLEEVIEPYPLPQPTIAAAEAALSPSRALLVQSRVALIKAEPDLSLEELALRIEGELGLRTSTSAVDRFVQRHELSYKKNPARGRARSAGRGPGA